MRRSFCRPGVPAFSTKFRIREIWICRAERRSVLPPASSGFTRSPEYWESALPAAGRG